MSQLGGHAMFMHSKDTQLGRGEPIEDVAQVISRMTNIVMVRTYEQSIIERFAENSLVPVINGLTNEYHPCQIMADIFTWVERNGPIQGKTVAWIGDSNNVSRTWLQAAKVFDFKLNLACPRGYEMTVLDGQTYGSRHFEQFYDPFQAARDADIVTTDVSVSMGYERETLQRKRDFLNYRVSEKKPCCKPRPMRCSCIACRRIVVKKWTPKSSTVRNRWSGKKPKTACTHKKAVLEYLLLGKVDN